MPKSALLLIFPLFIDRPKGIDKSREICYNNIFMSLSNQSIAAATKAIQENQRILVIPHANVDPDGLSSALACYHVLHELGKDVTVICPDTKPECLEFLPGFEQMTHEIGGKSQFVITVNLSDGVEVDKLRYTVEDNRVNIIVVPASGVIKPSDISLGEGEKPFDLIITVDTADLSLLGSIYTENIDVFSEIPILNIDHHISNSNYGQIQLIDPTSASATEVLYNWFNQVPDWMRLVTPDVATLLLTGLITDTRSFQNPNTTPRSLEIAAELLEKGARQQEIIQNIYKTKPLSTLKIWGRALNGIQIDPNAGIVWSTISKDDLAEMNATSKETHGILDELISTIPDADVYVLFTELEEGGLKASVRSSAKIDISKLAGELFNGGGHPRAAGFRIKEFDNFSLAVLDCVAKMKVGMKKQLDDEGSDISMAAEETPELKEEKKDPTPDINKKKIEKTEVKSIEVPKPLKNDQINKDIDIVKGINENKENKDSTSGTDVVKEISAGE